MKIQLITASLLLSINVICKSQAVKILFDATKAETAANADWVLDADTHNLGPNGSGVMVTGQGNESNPQRYPTPAQSGITASTAETFWEGSLSSWGIDLVKKGYEVETLPNADSITYGNTSHAQDLSNYKVLIIDEPNIRFTLRQRNAMVNFVKNGGGLFIISDHVGSDRNNDGWDSPHIWNDVFANNTVKVNPFGIKFDSLDFSGTYTNLANIPSDTCLHGPKGNVTKIKYSNGTSMTLDRTANTSVTGLIFNTGYSNTGTTGVLFARALFGTGKIVALGDSSPPDDGTGDPNDVLYNGYTDPTISDSSHQKLLVDATIWLIERNTTTTNIDVNENISSVTIFPNPSTENITVRLNLKKATDVSFEIYDITGRMISKNERNNFDAGMQNQELAITSKGYYFVRIVSSEGVITKPFIID